jgi:hypothetical protein
MRMMKNNNNETVMVIGIDHGYGNMKTATRCFPSGVARYDKEPIIFLFTMACITRSERNTRSSVQRKRRMRTIMC